jgi:threonine synthase
MGTVIARQMGLPVEKIICGVNENTEFPDFLATGTYTVRPSIKSPSSAMIVSHPSNLARLIDFYGVTCSTRGPATGNVTRPGIIDRMPDMQAMRRDIVSLGVSNPRHFETMKDVYERYGIILDPHGAVGWAVLEEFVGARHDRQP